MKLKILKKITKREILLMIAMLVIGLLLGGIFGNKSQETEESHEHAENVEEEITYTCSMHPQIRQDEPGQCPICGMDLVPVSSVESDEEDIDPDEIQMTESAIALANIQTFKVEKRNAVKEIYLLGKVKADERNKAELTARFNGRIEKLFINFTGQHVTKGQKLATIYSPELITAQKELLEAMKYKDSNPSFYKAARGKLRLWDLTNEQIDNIEQNAEPKMYFDILSPITGTVMKRNVALGDYVNEGTTLFEVIDLSRVWVMFEAYESDLPWIKTGDKINFTLRSVPGKQFSGTVNYIDPFIDPATRITQVRVEVPNSKMELKPEMFAKGILESEIAANTNTLIIPKSAVLWTGKRSVVYVKVPDRKTPSFLYREIVLGPEAGNFYVINEGLNEGEEIAVNGVFKIDASAQLAGKTSMMNPEGEKVSLGHDHGNGGETTTQEEHADVEIKANEINTPEQFKKQLTGVYNTYLKLKDAFIESDNDKVNKEAADLLKDMKKVDMGLLKGDAHMVWMDHLEVLNKTIEFISKSSDIEKQRQEFAKFNLTFYKSLKTFGLSNTTAYFQYCPMANRDQGAYWFSDSKEIRNPYFGDAMMSCGETRETIK